MHIATFGFIYGGDAIFCLIAMLALKGNFLQPKGIVGF
jgi:hypothetical protein